MLHYRVKQRCSQLNTSGRTDVIVINTNKLLAAAVYLLKLDAHQRTTEPHVYSTVLAWLSLCRAVLVPEGRQTSFICLIYTLLTGSLLAPITGLTARCFSNGWLVVSSPVSSSHGQFNTGRFITRTVIFSCNHLHCIVQCVTHVIIIRKMSI